MKWGNKGALGGHVIGMIINTYMEGGVNQSINLHIQYCSHTGRL